MLPLFLDLRDRRVLILGGGEVALRKAQFFARGARVRVASRDFLPAFRQLPVELIPRVLQGGEEDLLREADVVVPATDDRELNDRLAALARRLGKWVDRVDAPGDLMVPATVRRGAVTVAIGTQGRAPILARYLRERLEEFLGEEYGPMADILGEVREELKGGPGDLDREATLDRIVRDGPLWDLVRRGDLPAARRRARELAGLGPRGPPPGGS